MSDVREAAERLRPLIGTTVDTWNAPSQALEDMWTLAESYLAANPPDDEVPIDENWLRSVGFQAKKYQGDEKLAMSFPSPLGDSQWIECTESATVFLLCRYSPMYDDDTPPDRVQVTAKTRVDLRRLCAALGITLKESEASNG